MHGYLETLLMKEDSLSKQDRRSYLDKSRKSEIEHTGLGLAITKKSRNCTTDRETLRNKDPALLDIRNLDPIPVMDFEAMGDSDYRVDIGEWRLELNGRAKKLLRLNYSQILALPSIERDVLLICPGFLPITAIGRAFLWRSILNKRRRTRRSPM